MDGWQIGDLALCVDDGPLKTIAGLPEARREYVEALRKGVIYTVTHIARGITYPCIGLGDEAKKTGGVSTRFRKIRPLSDEERDSFLADLDAPVFTPEPSEVATADTARTARVDHFSPLGALPGSLPGPSAVDTSRHADGSGLLFNRAHAVEVPNGR